MLIETTQWSREMTALRLPFFSFYSMNSRKPEPTNTGSVEVVDPELRRILDDMIAAGSCDSEYGAHMLMSIYPGKV